MTYGIINVYGLPSFFSLFQSASYFQGQHDMPCEARIRVFQKGFSSGRGPMRCRRGVCQNEGACIIPDTLQSYKEPACAFIIWSFMTPTTGGDNCQIEFTTQLAKCKISFSVCLHFKMIYIYSFHHLNDFKLNNSNPMCIVNEL